MKFMFDTNIFNEILDKRLAIDFDKHEYYVTHIQFDELNATKDIEKREKLIETFNLVESKRIPTESALWDISDWDDCKWSDETSIRDLIFDKLEAIKSKNNNKQDSLIGEAAVLNDYVLVTNDQDFNQVICDIGGKAIFIKEYLIICKGGGRL